MMHFSQEKTRQEAGINITSLIDVIFLLVVFFMVSSTFDTSEKPAFDLVLPEARSGTQAEQGRVVIAVSAGGDVSVRGRLVQAAELDAVLAALAAAEPDVKVALDCDGGASFQAAAQVLDALSLAGIRRVALRHDYPRR